MRISVIILLSIVLVSLAGCSSFETYFQDRALDFVDCFHCDVGVGFGLEAHFIATDVFSYCIGGGNPNKFGFNGRYVGTWEDNYLGFPLCNYMIWYYQAHPMFAPRNSPEPSPINWACLQMPFPVVSSMELFKTGDKKNNFTEYGSVLTINFVKGVNGSERLPFCDLLDAFRFETGVTIFYFGAAVGFNGGQFADFFLGWFGIDIAGDDTKDTENTNLYNSNGEKGGTSP
jgi:hypothetical protein